MKKQDIKSDPIKDKIVDIVDFIVSNSRIVWILLFSFITIIVLISYYSSNIKNQLQNENLQLGILQNQSIHLTDSSDLLLNEYQKIIDTYSKSESYNQAFIYLLNHYLINNDTDNFENLLFNNKFKSNDQLQNAFLYKVKADYYQNNGENDNSINNYIKAIDTVENYDLKVLYSMELINLYIKNDNIYKAQNAYNDLKDELKNFDKLSFTSKNNLDYIESKLLHLLK